MPTRRINELLSSLPFDKKLVVVGSILMVFSLFMPWYQDQDRFNTGDLFLGLTGPLYLAGFSLLILAALNLALIVFDILNRKMPLFSIRSQVFFLIAGLASFYILLVINSVYFHPKFGINITVKQSDFGMFFAFIAASLVTIGGYLAGRDKASLLKNFQQEAQAPMVKTLSQEPLVKMPQLKPHENLIKTATTNMRKPQVRSVTPSTERIGASPHAGNHQAVQTKIAEPEEAAKPPPQPFRMDL